MPQFVHRKHPDGTWDSICTKCLLTVVAKAKVRTEEELGPDEARHVCHFSKLDSEEHYRKTSPPRGD